MNELNPSFTSLMRFLTVSFTILCLGIGNTLQAQELKVLNPVNGNNEVTLPQGDELAFDFTSGQGDMPDIDFRVVDQSNSVLADFGEEAGDLQEISVDETRTSTGQLISTNTVYEWQPGTTSSSTLPVGTYEVTVRGTDGVITPIFTSFTLRVVRNNCKVEVEFEEAKPGTRYSKGEDIYVLAVANRPSRVRSMRLFINDRLLETEQRTPYEWGRPHHNNLHRLNNMQPGAYTLKLEIRDHCGQTQYKFSTIFVEDYGCREPSFEFKTPHNDACISRGSDLYVKVDRRSFSARDIRSMTLYVNGHQVRTESFAPYEWGRPHTHRDHALNNMQPGVYHLKVEVEHTCGHSFFKHITVYVKNTCGGSRSQNRTTGSTIELSTFPLSPELSLSNAPNPFQNATTIQYSLPQNAQKSSIQIFNATGVLMKEIPVSGRNNGSVELTSEDLPTSGYYFYSLLVDGQRMMTKKMIRI